MTVFLHLVYVPLRCENCPKCNQLQPFLKSIFTFIVSQQHVPQVQKDMSITMEQNIFITTNVNLLLESRNILLRYDICPKCDQLQKKTTF
jgi:hypothetical protein